MCPCLGAPVLLVLGGCLAAAGSVVVALLVSPTCRVGFVGIVVASDSPVVAASKLAVLAVVDGELAHAGCRVAAAIATGGGAVAAVVFAVVVDDVALTALVAEVEVALGYSPDAFRVGVAVVEPGSVLAAASALAFGCGVHVVVVVAASIGCTALLASASAAVVGGSVVAVVGVGASFFVDCHVPVAPVSASSLPVRRAVVCDVVLVELAVVATPDAIASLLAPDGVGGAGAFFAPAVTAVVAGLVECVAVHALLVDAAATCVVLHARLALG
ncbi:hypothetical protein CBR_g84840 [Chara braunii]|uniref:Uncharacterized protein n=1 Tax=Chara braunii TaxID=69332 RepID=A0A388KB00_CHABU|nr:hypothetical protein CBR_g84840 [Chara braunii]|eukprot:GBG67176.1 hypothetical protein CBR_g84840 [Chara braunii]